MTHPSRSLPACARVRSSPFAASASRIVFAKRTSAQSTTLLPPEPDINRPPSSHLESVQDEESVERGKPMTMNDLHMLIRQQGKCIESLEDRVKEVEKIVKQGKRSKGSKAYLPAMKSYLESEHGALNVTKVHNNSEFVQCVLKQIAKEDKVPLNKSIV